MNNRPGGYHRVRAPQIVDSQRYLVGEFGDILRPGATFGPWVYTGVSRSSRRPIWVDGREPVDYVPCQMGLMVRRCKRCSNLVYAWGNVLRIAEQDSSYRGTNDQLSAARCAKCKKRRKPVTVPEWIGPIAEAALLGCLDLV